MKKLFALSLCLASLAASAQSPLVLINVGTNADTGSGERIGRQTWINQNNNFLSLQAQVNIAASNALAEVPYTRLPANVTYSSGTTILLSSNPFVFSGGSNFIGTFTNIWTFTEPVGDGPYTNIMSVDGGATWQDWFRTNLYSSVLVTNNGTNYVGTNAVPYSTVHTNTIWAPIQLAVLSGLSTTGAVLVTTLSRPELNGRPNTFVGQSFDFTDADVSGLPATTVSYYPSNTWNLSAVTGAMANFSFWTGTSNGQALVTLSLSNGVVRYLQVLK